LIHEDCNVAKPLLFYAFADLLTDFGLLQENFFGEGKNAGLVV